jgi:hypothetical protein
MRCVAQFICMVPTSSTAKFLREGLSVQLLGLEIYDTKVAIDWRVIPAIGETSSMIGHDLEPFDYGLEQATITLADDVVGTAYHHVGGHSGGWVERVGRSEFQPPPPISATLLLAEWKNANFEIALPAASDSGDAPVDVSCGMFYESQALVSEETSERRTTFEA